MIVANWKYQGEPFATDLSESLGLPDGYVPAWFGAAEHSLLKARWEAKEGVFLFLRMKLPDVESDKLAALNVLEGRLREFLREPLNAQVRFLWIENPLDPLILWRFHSISVQAQNNKLSQRAFLNARNYAFSIAQNTAISLVGENFILSPEDNTIPAFRWSSEYGEHSFEGITDVRIPMTGTDAGCLKFQFSIPRKDLPTSMYGYPGLSQLDIGIRIFFRDPEFPESGDKFYLSSHRYPFLQESYEDAKAKPYFPASIDWQVSLDPIYPLSRQRSFFEFSPLASPNAGLPSGFRTNRGYTVHLLPQSSESRLVFAHRPATLKGEDLQDSPYYLVPAGKFELKIPVYKADQSLSFVPEANVICGLSGLEYVKVLHNEHSFLSLVPDQAAFAPAFVSAYALLRDLTGIIQSKTDVSFPADTIDLDMPFEEKQNMGLGINDEVRKEILHQVKLVYFPPDYEFSDAAQSAFMALEIVEDMVNWLSKTLQTAGPSGGGQEALVHYPDPGAKDPAGRNFPTSSWAYFHEGGGATYYGQPDQAVLYRAESSSVEFLDYMEVPALGLPDSLTTQQTESLKAATAHASLSFPLLPYGNVDPGSLTDMLHLENLLVSNFRFGRIRAISKATSYITPLRNLGNSPLIGTTPQGLIATYTRDDTFTNALKIETLQLAMYRSKKTVNKVETAVDAQVQMVNIPHNAPLKGVLQSNQVFMVITDPNTLKDYFSANALKDLPGVTSQVDIENWIFELGTDHWEKNGTVLVFKFHDKPLMELAAKPELWSLPNDFNQNKELASIGLQELVNTALESGSSEDPKVRKKYAAILPAITQANWTGILAFNVDVSPDNMPDDLKALAGGMDPDLFYAKYVGIEVTPVESSGTGLLAKPSSFFALIDYQNNITPPTDISGYNFHVPYLTVVFRNSLITDFAAEVQLFVEYLFHEAAHLVGSSNGRNVLSLKGSAEKHNGKTTYAFGFSGANRFELSGKVLQEIEIVKAQFATDPLPEVRPNPLSITGRFFLWGRIRFAHLEAFDVLSFGAEPTPTDPPKPDYLSMNNLQITMSFKMKAATVNPTASSMVTDKLFEFKPQQMAFDLKQSGWRLQSLYEKFPLKFKAFKTILSDANALRSSGYMPVSSPLKTVELGDTWYGMEYDLNLGSAGALAGNLGLVAGILVAWNPEEEGVYVGLKLPGSTGGKKEITIQGLIKIAFKSIRFETYKDPKADAPDNLGYLLKLKNIVLKFMVVSFPPSGQTEIILFGDPRSPKEVPLRKDKLLGWYASYVKK